jgi:hypothetical protein
MTRSKDSIEILIDIIKVAAIAIIGFIIIKAILQAAA